MFRNSDLHSLPNLEEIEAWNDVDNDGHVVDALVYNACDIKEEFFCASANIARCMKHVRSDGDQHGSTVNPARMLSSAEITEMFIDLNYSCVEQ